MADVDADEHTSLLVVRPERYHANNRRTSSGRKLIEDPLITGTTTTLLPLWSSNTAPQEGGGQAATTEPLDEANYNHHHHHSHNHHSHHCEDHHSSQRDRRDSGMFRESSMMEVMVETLTETLTEVKEEVQHVLEEPVAIPVAPRDPGDHQRTLTAVSLAVLVFYKVSGGPFGCEVSVQSAGALYTLLGFLLFPILWSVPEALVTAELGSAFPEPSGPIAWVEEAFGGPASLLCGYFHYVSGATDNAIYPSLFLKYLTDRNFAASTRFAICSVITIVLSIVNYLGLEIVGNLSVAVCIFSMSPFAILCVLAVPKIHMARWLQQPVGPIQWRGLLNNLFWNFNSFDVGANFAGEVKDPATVFPRAMFMSVLLVVSAYLFSLCAALGAVDTVQSDWNAGFFTDLATAIGGPWLGIWMVVAAAISNIALFEAELSGDSFQLMGMAERGLIPKVFAKRSRFQTPTNGIITGVIIIIAVSLADFEQLVAMLNFAYSLALIMQFAAFVQLRISQPDADRPYRVPLSTLGCALFVTPPTCFLAYILCTASRLTYIYFAALSAFGLVFHLFQKTAKHYHLIEYVQAPARIKKIATKLSLDKKG